MARHSKIHLKVHDEAMPQWKVFLANQPGKKEDVVALVRLYITDWVKRILPKLRAAAESAAVTRTCSFDKDYEFRFAIRETGDEVVVFITDVRRLP